MAVNSSGWRGLFVVVAVGIGGTLIACRANCQTAPIVQISEEEVACRPAGDWLYQFPAISMDDHEIAVLTDPSRETGVVSLQVYLASDRGLQLEREVPLFELRQVDPKECLENLGRGLSPPSVVSPEHLASINAQLSENSYYSMFPLDARNIHGTRINDLSEESEEVVSWQRYHILTDLKHGVLTVSRVGGDGSEIMAKTEYESSRRLFESQFTGKESREDSGAKKPCSGKPVPVGIWKNRGVESSENPLFLVHIAYVPSEEDCHFPSAWIIESVE